MKSSFQEVDIQSLNIDFKNISFKDAFVKVDDGKIVFEVLSKDKESLIIKAIDDGIIYGALEIPKLDIYNPDELRFYSKNVPGGLSLIHI